MDKPINIQNCKIAISRLFHKLKEFGVLKEYLENYASFHGVSKGKVKCDLFKQITNPNESVTSIYHMLVRRFARPDNSFLFASTPQGYTVWVDVWLDMCHDINIEVDNDTR